MVVSVSKLAGRAQVGAAEGAAFKRTGSAGRQRVRGKNSRALEDNGVQGVGDTSALLGMRRQYIHTDNTHSYTHRHTHDAPLRRFQSGMVARSHASSTASAHLRANMAHE